MSCWAAAGGLAQSEWRGAERAKLDAAIAAYDKAIELAPGRPESYVQRGSTYLRKARTYDVVENLYLKKALEDLDRAIALRPARGATLAAAHYARGIVHLYQREPDKAIADLDTAAVLNPRFAPAFAERGRAFQMKNEHDRAIADFSKALKLDPGHAESRYRRGASWRMKGQLDRAMADLNEAIRLAPMTAGAYAERAEVRLRTSELALAVEDAAKAIRLQPKLVRAHVIRAFAETRLGHLDAARADYDELIKQVPSFAGYYRSRADVLEALGRSREAAADRLRAASLETGNPRLPFARPSQAPPGIGTRMTGSPAVPSAFGATNASPSGMVKLLAAAGHIKHGKYDLAIAELDTAIALQPKAWAAYAFRGYAYSVKKAYRHALADASKAIELNPQAGMALVLRCGILMQTKVYRKALADCEKAIELGRVPPIAFALRGGVRIGLKSYPLAIADFDKAITMGAPASAATYGRGLAFLYSKQVARAADDFRSVLKADPGHRGAALGLRLLTRPMSTTARMKVEVVRHAGTACGDHCAEWIAAQGRIDKTTPARFSAVLAALGHRRLPVFIDSPGGNLRASYEIGRMIRARGLDVYVTRTEPAPCPLTRDACRKPSTARRTFGLPRGKLASCASACINILASGTARSVGPTALVGLHQAGYYWEQKDRLVNAKGRKVPARVYTRMKDYFVEMGVDASLMSKVRATPHKDMYWLTQDELLGSRLASQRMSGEELVTGSETDDWIAPSPVAAMSVEKLLRAQRK